MKEKTILKRAFSAVLSVVLVISMINVTEPKQAAAADASTNLLANSGFDNASDSWVDQEGTLVPAQELVDDVDVTLTSKYTNDFTSGSVEGWNINNTTTSVVEKDGNQVLSFTRGTNSYITYYGTAFEAEKTYVISCKVYCDEDTSFRLYNEATGKAVYDMKTAPAGEWTEYSITVTASSAVSQPSTYFGIMDAHTQVYIDDVTVDIMTVTENMVASYSDVYYNDFAGTSPTHAWNINNTTTSVVEVDGNEVLSFTPGTNTYVTYYGCSSLVVGETYRLSCKVYTDTAVDFRLYDNATGKNDHHTATAGTWNTYTVDLTATKTSTTLYFGIMDGSAGPIYIDDVYIQKYEGEVVAQTYSEGIGTCNDTEESSVLVMEAYTKVAQPVTITAGNVYDYSFKVKSEETGSDFILGVTAGENVTEAVAVTSEWTEITGSFTATVGATEFGFVRAGTGKVFLDDVVLNETSAMPSDHTTIGAYVPEGHMNLLSGSNWDFSSTASGYNGNATWSTEDGMLKISSVTNSAYVQAPSFSVKANVAYTFSCYVWVTEATGTLSGAIYHTNGAGMSWQNYACNLPTGDSEEWQLMTYEFTPTDDGTLSFGFTNRNSQSATIYVDDIALTMAKTVVTDHTTMENGGNMLPEGATNLISNGDFGTAGSLGNGVTAAEGVAAWTPAAADGYYYQVGIQATAGHSYRVSYFVQICEASTVSYDMYMSGAGSPTGGWQNYILKNSATIANLKDATHSASITSNTDGWELVEYTWTAPADGTAYIGFRSYAKDESATIYLDDLVVYDINYTPTDHSNMEGGGYYIDVEEAVNLNGAGAFSSSSGWNGSGYEITDGMGILNATNEYLQTTSFSLTQGHTYTMSAYVWVTEADSSLSFDWFSSGDASPKGSWLDKGMANWDDYVSTSNVSCNRSASLTSNTYGWELVTVTWTAPADGTCYFGFKIYGGTGSVYVDDVAIYDHEVAEVLVTDITVSYTSRNSDGTWYFAQTGLTVSENTYYKVSAIIDGKEAEVPIQFKTDGSMTIWPNFFTVYGGTAPVSSIKIAKDTIMKQVSSSGWGEVAGAARLKVTNDVHIYLNEYQQWVDPSNTDTGVACDLTFSWFDYYSEKMAAFSGMPQSSGNYVALSGAVQVNGTNYGATFTHNETSVTFTFASGSLAEALSETEVNKIVIPKGLVLYHGTDAVCHMNSEAVFYVQYLQGQWLSWTSEYEYQGEDGGVQYYDMGTTGTEYVFNNNADASYMGVLTVSGQADIGLGGQASASKALTELGDYHVVRTIRGEKYDYTVSLYKRGDADKSQDSTLTSQDLVATKWAVQTNEESFGHARYKAADSNTDGVVNEADAAFMRRVLAGDYDITKVAGKGYTSLGQGVMPIIGYGGPDDHNTSPNTDLLKRNDLNSAYKNDFLTDEIMGLVADLGFNTFVNQVNEVGSDYETSTRMLKIAEKYNMGVYINNGFISGASTVGAQLVPQTAKYDSFASFHGYYIKDEPADTDEIGEYTTQLTALKNHVNIATFFNMHPIWSSGFTESSYKTYLQTAANTDAEALCYDLYLRSKDYWYQNYQIRTADFYKNLDVARTQSMAVSKPFHAFVQTGANWVDSTSDNVDGNNLLTIQEMYLEANAALAMGAKGIHYFTLLESTNQVDEGDNYSGLITVSGEANHNEGGNYDYYNAAKKINTYIAKVDEVLMNAANKGVITDNSTVTSNVSCEMSSYGVLGSVTGSEYMIGCFDYYGKDAYLVVNITPDGGGAGSSQDITLHFNKEITYNYTFMDGTTGTATGSSATGTIAAGESVLIVVE